MLPLEKLTIRARAIATSFGMSNNNNTQIAVQCEVVDDERFNGESIAWIGHFTDKTAARTIESLEHMGWKGEDLSELEDLDRTACERMLPDVVELVCEPEEYDGQWTLKVRWVNKPGAGRFAFKQPLKGNDLKAFAAQMRATVKSVRGTGGARPANGQRATGKSGGYSNVPPISDEDIPFASSDSAHDPSPISHALRHRRF